MRGPKLRGGSHSRCHGNGKKNKLELEVEPEVLTELLHFHGKTLTFEHLLLMDEHRK